MNNTQGFVKLDKTDLSGAVSGQNIIQSTVSYDKIAIGENIYPPKPKSVLYTDKEYGIEKTGAVDVTVDIQKALDDAGESGGGIVYLSAGFYKVTQPIIVPENVLLRGSSPIPNRDQPDWSSAPVVGGGTMLLSFYGENESDHLNAPALITLSGDRAGVSGLRIINPENNPSTPGQEGTVKSYPFAVRGKGNNVYVTNLGFAGAYNGIEMKGSNNFLIKGVVGAYYNIGIRVENSEGGHIENILHNSTNVTRVNLRNRFDEFGEWAIEENIFNHVIDPITRPNLSFLVFSNSNNQTVLNAFAYGPRNFLHSTDSRVALVNIGGDNLGRSDEETGYMIHADGGNVTAVNMMRFNGSSYNAVNNPVLRLVNRASLYVGEEEEDVALD